MKTSTILIAFTDSERELAQARGEAKAQGVEYYSIRDKKRIRQAETFQAELLRRMNEQDARILALEKQLLAERAAYSERAARQVADGAVKLLTEELAEARNEANQLRASYTRVEAWANALTEAAAAHAQTGSAWRVAARRLCDALGIDIGDTNDPYAGLLGAIEAVKALKGEA